jgi:HlyD family secretion protein
MRRLALAVLLAAAAPQARADGEPPAPAAAAPAAPAITVTAAVTRRLTDRIIASGFVGPVERVSVQPLIEGQPIEALLADVGDSVAAGAVLARLSASTLVLQKSQAEAQLAAARATVAQGEALLLEAEAAADEARRVSDRTAALRQRGNASQAAADQAEAAAISAAARVTAARQSLAAARAQVALSEAQLANIDLQLERTEVKAPVAGAIVERNARVGAIASAAGQPMFVLIRDGALEVNADVAEGDVMRLRPGQTARLRFVGAPAAIPGRVRLIEPAIDATTRLGRVRIWIDPGAPVVSGMFADAEVIVAEREAVAVPITAVSSSPEGATVMRVEGGVAKRVVVETGIRDGGWIEIVAGLAAGDVVVARAGAFVRDGDRINPVPAAVN